VQKTEKAGKTEKGIPLGKFFPSGLMSLQ
jgi:hypothetical protein